MIRAILFLAAITATVLSGSVRAAVAGENRTEGTSRIVLCETGLGQQGCCSWHGGVCGCDDGRTQCCDGSPSRMLKNYF